MALEIPEVVIDRLPVYARALTLLEQQGREVVSSQELGERLSVTPAQIRKDLSYFGRFGKQGRGYNVKRLLEELRQILGLTREWSMVLVGVGQLGRAIVGYGGFTPQGFRIVEAFDADPKIIGTKVDGLVVKSVDSLPDVLRKRRADIGIVAAPAASAQEVIDMLIANGVKAILNYAPIAAQTPADVRIKDIDPVLALQSMTFYVKNLDASAE
jgi:redox-sensing transcriptional repressor